ncbi:MAG: phage holin family protein [Aestuariivirgaceae bacterium]
MVQGVQATAKDQPLGDLLVTLAYDGKSWLAAEVAVIRAQMEESTRKLLSAMMLLITAAVIALAGIMVLAHALVLVLAPSMGVGLAGLLVGGLLVALAMAFVVYARPMMDLSQLVPERLRSEKSFKLNGRGR